MTDNNLNYKKIIKILNSAKRSAISDNSYYVLLDHILEILLYKKNILKLLYKFNNEINPDNIKNIYDNVRNIVKNQIKQKLNKNNIKPVKDLELVIYHARLQSLFFGKNQVDYVDLFIAILFNETPITQYLLSVYNIDINNIIQYVSEKYKKSNDFQSTILSITNNKSYQIDNTSKNIMKLMGDTNVANSPNNSAISSYNKTPYIEGYTSIQTSKSIIKSPNDTASLYKKIESFCKNMNEEVKSKNYLPIINRQNEYSLIEHTINRMLKPNILLIGQPGVGKTAIVEGFVSEINKGNIASLKDYTVYSVDIGSLLSGTKYRGEFEEKMRNFLEFASKQKNTLFFIDEFHLIMGAGSGSDSSVDVANMLKPYLTNGSISIIGSTTDKEYRSKIEKDKALTRRFYKININPPTKEDMVKILKGIKYKFENYYNINFSNEFISHLIMLCDKFQPTINFPDKAIDILDSVGAFYGKKSKTVTITKKILISHFSNITTIPENLLHNEQDFDYDKIYNHLQKTIIGQDNTLSTVLDLLTLSYSGLHDTNKPMLSLLMRGATGVGKTEFAKQLSNILSIPLIRFDMSEYNESHSISKLIGSPAGYVGYSDGDGGSGLLVNKIETQSTSILLLDEIEKAHPNVINILLQVLDTGFLTSASGKKISFKNVIILMTSNIGALQEQKNNIGFIQSDENDKGEQEMKQFFVPEFLNRLDGVIRFNNLSNKSITDIITLNINHLKDTLSQQKIYCVIDQTIIDKIFNESILEKNMGARPINRLIDKYVKIPISKHILNKNFKNNFCIKYKNNNSVIEMDNQYE